MCMHGIMAKREKVKGFHYLIVELAVGNVAGVRFGRGCIQ